VGGLARRRATDEPLVGASTPVLATKRALTRATIMAAQTHGPVSALGSLSDVASGGA
jgi:hypothetical protein